MATLEASFEDHLQQAVLDDVEAKESEVGEDLKEVAVAELERYADRHGYDLSHITQNVDGPFVNRRAEGISIRLDFGAYSAIFEWGAPEHTIEGMPVLHWIDSQTGEDVFATEVLHPGTPEANAIRSAFDV